MSHPAVTRASHRHRRRGRPDGHDRDLRERLLDAAAVHFARSGIAATSLRTIAAAVDVTPAMLHYYFGGKAQLVQALVEERLLPALVPVQAALDHAGAGPLALAEAFVRGMDDLVDQKPWLPALWVREVLCEGGGLRRLLLERFMPRLPQALARRFAAMPLGDRLDPHLLVVSLVGLTLFPAAGAPIWRQAFGLQSLHGQVLRDHTLALLAHGLAASSSMAGEAA